MFYSINLIFSLLLIPLLSIIIILFLNNLLYIKCISLLLSLIIFFLSLNILIEFNIFNMYYHITFELEYFSIENINFIIGIDGISIWFILLTALLFPICLLVNWESVKFRIKKFTLILFLLEFLLFNFFMTIDLFFFFIFFEAVLIPMFLIIGIWGSRQRKINAAYQFFFFTSVGSILMLISILIIYLHTGTLNFIILKTLVFTENRQLLLWFFFFISLAVKVPIMPFHIWLPEAHVEAPTTGSILLAGILLKLGTYGFIRILLNLFPYACKYFTPLIFIICIISIIYSSFSTIRQIDLKKIIAYSSVAHMNFAIIGLFCNNNILGIKGSLFLMLSHGIISSALFFCIGILYDRYHTKILYYYCSFVQIMPIYSTVLFIFLLSNMGFPLTSGFIGEILILISIFSVNFKITLILLLSMVLSAVYSLWLFNRLVFGEVNLLKMFNFKKFSDFSKREFFIILPLLFFNFYFGIYPNLIFNSCYCNILYLINSYNYVYWT